MNRLCDEYEELLILGFVVVGMCVVFIVTLPIFAPLALVGWFVRRYLLR